MTTRFATRRSRGVLLALLVIFASIGFAGVAQAQRHELLARDINGYALDMTVEQVAAVAHQRLHSIGGGQFQVNTDGVDYDLGFSSLGHLYRIDSKQDLGHFIPDANFSRTLAKKLSDKFGEPGSDALPGGPIGWGYSETYPNGNSGQMLTRPTVELSAFLLGGYGQSISLNTHLIDFRIMRRDLAGANAVPRSKAENGIKY